MTGVDPTALPAGLPVPADDGAARHLPGLRLPALALPSTDGGLVDLADLGPGLTVLYVYPMTATPGTDLPHGWDELPGARGCTAQACSMRDHLAEIRAAGAERVLGLSGQTPAAQAEAHERLHLPFALLSDEHLRTAQAVPLPTFELGGTRYLRRLTMVVGSGQVEHLFHPVFPPDTHGAEVAQWLRER